MFLDSRLIVGGYLTRARWYLPGRTRFKNEKVKTFSLGFPHTLQAFSETVAENYIKSYSLACLGFVIYVTMLTSHTVAVSVVSAGTFWRTICVCMCVKVTYCLVVM